MRLSSSEHVIKGLIKGIHHGRLARVAGGGSCAKVATQFVARLFGFSARVAERKRKAAQHRSDNPARVSILQQQTGRVAFLFGDGAAVNFNIVDQDPRDGVRFHRHIGSFGLVCTPEGGPRAGGNQPQRVCAPVAMVGVAHV